MTDEVPSDFLASEGLESAIRRVVGARVGERLGTYELTALLGTGGMGEVYRAHDTKLGREVAIKVLPPEFSADRERLARLEREARVLASLNHPNIGAIYGLEQMAGAPALILELIEGETLAERLNRSPLRVRDAMSHARQIAEALDAAHERGIIHRDLKPANVKITPAGAVKVLDFGLAKVAGPVEGERTRDGAVLGTASYMSPEQAHGHPVDKRADIWSFGCVLFEMLTGKRAFPEPDWRALPADTPARVQLLLHRCLENDPARRLRDIGDAALELDARGSVDAASRSKTWHSYAPWALTALLAVGIAAILITYPDRRPRAPLPIARASISTQPLSVLNHAASSIVALSPDGTHIAYVAGPPTRIYLRRLDSLEATPLSGVDTAHTPFFSPDGMSIGFISRRQLKTMPVAGGAPVLVCDVLNVAHGASWGTDGTILFSDQDGIHRVPERGGTPQLVGSGFWPEALPRGANGFVFTDFSEPSPKVWAHSWTGQRHILVNGGSHARYAASGHLIYASNGSLFAAPFDTEQLAITGAAIPVIKDVMMGLPQEGDIAHFAVSPAGTLAYLAGQRLGPGRTLAWVDHQGNEEPLLIEPQHYESPRLSPDGNRIAVEILEKPGGWNIWIYDRNQRFLKPLTSHPSHDKFPLWTRDGQRIIFNSTRDAGGWNLYSQAADGTGQPERLTLHSTKFGDGIPWIVTRDDKALIYSDGDDLQLLSIDDGRQSTPLLRGQTSQGRASLSPDGRWIAYASGETGTTRLHVRPFPDVESGRWEIPTSVYPSSIWARNGRELFYAGPDAMAVVPVETANAFAAGKARDLFPFKGRYVLDTPRNFDISHDGQRFLMIKEAPENAGALAPSARDELVVVFNWFEELKRLAPRRSQ